MSFRVLDLPEDPAELAPWLDRQLVGLDLGRFVAELEAVHASRSSRPAPSLDSVLAGRLGNVLRRGLTALPRPALSTLLAHPRLLLDLQERVLEAGGDYWGRLSRNDPEVTRVLDVEWSRLAVSLGLGTPGGRRNEPLTLVGTVPAAPAARPSTRAVFWRTWAQVATLAASILAVFYLTERAGDVRPAAVVTAPLTVAPPAVATASRPWGWNVPGVLTRQEDPSAYFKHLADDAGHWFDERPEGPDALAARLGELRTGCSRLILAEHRSLSAPDRAWLVERCRTWATKFDDAIRDLEQGEGGEVVRETVDRTVASLVKALRERAAA